MSSQKRINGNYTIEALGAGTQIGLTAASVLVTGNLVVTGSYDTQTVTNTEVLDKDMTLNAGESGAGITGGTAGITVERGSLTNARLLYDEATDLWKIDQGSGSLVPIVQSVSGLTEVIDDTTPQLSGALDVNGQSIISASNGDITIAPNGTGVTIINSAITLSEESDPTGAANVTKVYAKEAASGGTGLWVVTDTVGPEELVSKSKAIVYGIIF